MAIREIAADMSIRAISLGVRLLNVSVETWRDLTGPRDGSRVGATGNCYKKEKAMSFNDLNHATLYYPSDDGGKTLAGGDSVFQVIAFCHGTVIDVSKYEYLFEAWVSTGKYVVIANTFQYDGIFDMDTFGHATSLYVRGCMGLDDDDKDEFIPEQPSILKNRIDQTSFKVAGHSLGGGAAIFTALYLKSNCTGYLGFCPLTDPRQKVEGALKDLVADSDNVPPMLFLTGTADNVIDCKLVKALYSVGSRGTYGNIQGATHCHFTYPTSCLCQAAEDTASMMHPKERMPAPSQIAAAIQLSTAFFQSGNIQSFIDDPSTAFHDAAAGTTWNETTQN